MIDIYFKFDKDNKLINGEVIYSEEEYSFCINNLKEFHFSHGVSSNRTSLCIATLQIEVDLVSGRLLYPWGYFPLLSAYKKKLNLVTWQQGNVYVNTEKMEKGVSIRIPYSDSWPVFKDIETGWICIGTDEINNDLDFICFFENTVFVFKNNIPVALWIRPIYEKN
jgi:hypothetical protein